MASKIVESCRHRLLLEQFDVWREQLKIMPVMDAAHESGSGQRGIRVTERITIWSISIRHGKKNRPRNICPGTRFMDIRRSRFSLLSNDDLIVSFFFFIFKKRIKSDRSIFFHHLNIDNIRIYYFLKRRNDQLIFAICF